MVYVIALNVLFLLELQKYRLPLFYWNRKISLESCLYSLNASTGDDRRKKCDFVDAKLPYLNAEQSTYRRPVDCGVTFHPILFHSDESKWYENILS